MHRILAGAFGLDPGWSKRLPTRISFARVTSWLIDAVHPVCRARIVHEDPRDRAVDVYELTDDGSEPDVVRIGRPTRRTIHVGGSWQRSRASSATPQGHAL